MKKLLFIMLAFVLFGTVTGCKKSVSEIDELESLVEIPDLDLESKYDISSGLIEQGKLYVAISSDYAPFEFVNLTKTGQDKFVGSDVYFAKCIAKSFNLELVIKPMAFGSILTSIDSNKADIGISGFTASPERRLSYGFSDAYYAEGEGDQTLLVKASDKDKYTSLADFDKSSVKVAVQTGSVQQGLVEAQLPNANKILIDDLQNAITALQSGSYDAIAMAMTPALTAVQSKSDLSVSSVLFECDSFSFYALCKKGNSVLLGGVNKVIAELDKTKVYSTWVSQANAIYTKLGSDAEELVPVDTNK